MGTVGLERIVGTCRMKPAGGAEQGRKEFLVEPDEQDRQLVDESPDRVAGHNTSVV